MSKVSVICAVSPGNNPGMTSVDTAFRGVWERSGLDADVSYCQLYRWGESPSSQPGDQTSCEYKCFRDDLESLYDSDVIIYWGDFLHAHRYQKAVADILVNQKIARDSQQADEIVHRHFFLKDAPDEVLKKVLVYGGTMITNHPNDYLDLPYTQNLTRFMNGARQVWMREIYSGFKIGHLSDDYSPGHLGTDCSLLLRQDDIDRLPRGSWSQGVSDTKDKIGVYFGRSSCNPKLLGILTKELSRKLDVAVEWLPWGDVVAFEDYSKAVRKACPKLMTRQGEATPTMGDLLALLQGYRFVISDTYHVCVNAWRMNIPAICVGEAIPKTASNINSGKSFAWRDKRQVFFSMYDAMPFYTYAEELADRSWRSRRIWQLSQLLNDQPVIDATVQRIHHHRDLCEKRLVEEFTNMTTCHREANLAASR